jgi:cobalt-zinc-cadmium efflux system outer membrane protein
MFIGVFQLLAARQQEIDAGREYIEALRGYWTARAQLERAVGGQLPGIGFADASRPTTMPASAPAQRLVRPPAVQAVVSPGETG